MSHEILVAGETLIDFSPSGRAPSRVSTDSNVDPAVRRRTSPSRSPVSSACRCSGVGSATIRSATTSWRRWPSTAFPAGFETDPSAKTSLAFVTHDESGDRSFVLPRRHRRHPHGDGTDRRLGSRRSRVGPRGRRRALEWPFARGDARSARACRGSRVYGLVRPQRQAGAVAGRGDVPRGRPGRTRVRRRPESDSRGTRGAGLRRRIDRGCRPRRSRRATHGARDAGGDGSIAVADDDAPGRRRSPSTRGTRRTSSTPPAPAMRSSPARSRRCVTGRISRRRSRSPTRSGPPRRRRRVR